MDFITALLMGVASAISLALEWVPWLREKWAPLASYTKRLITAGLMLGITLAAYGVACYTTILATECPDPSIVNFVGNLIAAIVASQGTHRLGKRAGANSGG